MNRRAEACYARVAYAAGLSVILAWGWISPPPASAQVGGLIVTVTSPSPGSTVGGTTTVSASVSPLGVLVQRVQFQLDGNSFGEDATAPYSVPWNTRTASNGAHTLRAIAQDALGIWYPSEPVTVTVFNDITAPTVAITFPASGATVTGTITVSANASDNVGVVGVQFQLDGAPLGIEDTTAPYSATWNTATATIGTHTLRAVARDAANNVGNSSPVTVTVADMIAPSVSITAPTSGATVSDTITISAAASDNVGVAGVRFRVDGINIGAEDTTTPYSITWDTTNAVGNHSLSAVARDAAGNTAPSSPVAITVRDVTPPTVAVTSPAAGAAVTGTVSVTASASDNAGVAGVQFRLDGAPLGTEDTTAPYATTWNTTSAAEGSSHALAALARDAAGNTTTSASVTVTIVDKTPPTVAMTSPVSGATVSGTTTVSANASDNVGVAGVRFQLDGAPLGTEDTTPPYSVTWDTTTAADGSVHTLTAVARDAGNNTSTSSSVSVTVSNSSRGDVFVALVNGDVQWRNPDGTLRATLTGPSDGQASSVAFDAAGNIYVPHWYSQSGKQGNTVVRFDASGSLMGTFGSTYYCNPSSLTFDAQGNMYVGQADCTAEILKYDSAGNLVRTFPVQLGARGTDHIDLASDGCTMFYASRTRDIFRFDVCNNVQLPVFNTQPLPGDSAFHVKTLPDGGVLVADTQVVVRLDAAGNQVRTYSVTGESNIWGGVDIVGDGTFWASNAFTASIYKFDLETGAILASFNTGTGNGTAAGVGVRR
jgi:hypothetical protein